MASCKYQNLKHRITALQFPTASNCQQETKKSLRSLVLHNYNCFTWNRCSLFDNFSTECLLYYTRMLAITEGPRDALRQLKSCQLLRSCMKTFGKACSTCRQMTFSFLPSTLLFPLLLSPLFSSSPYVLPFSTSFPLPSPHLKFQQCNWLSCRLWPSGHCLLAKKAINGRIASSLLTLSSYFIYI